MSTLAENIGVKGEHLMSGQKTDYRSACGENDPQISRKAPISSSSLANSIGLQLIAASYPFAKTYWRQRTRFSQLHRKRAVIIYQMAKVGSSTIRLSLRAASLFLPIYFVHTLTRNGIKEMEEFYLSAGIPMIPKAGHLLVSRFLLSQLEKGLTGGRWKVITLVRDPIARNISLLFQQGPFLLSDFKLRLKEGTLDVVEVAEMFEQKYPSQVNCLDWFDRELKQTFGVDVFATEFNRTAGYQIYRNPCVDVLLLKLEQLAECAGPAFKKFLGLERFVLINTNIGLQKAYASEYKQFLDRIVLRRDYLERFYASEQIQHLYSDEEIDVFRRRWLRQSRSHSP